MSGPFRAPHPQRIGVGGASSDRRRTAGPGDVGAVRDVRGARRRRTPTRGQHGESAAAVRVPALLPAVRRTGRGPEIPAVPERYLSFRILVGAGTLGRARDSGGTGILLPQLRSGRTVAFYPGPAGATESELAIEAWTAVLDDNPVLATAVPTWRRSDPDPEERSGGGRVPSAADRCVLRTGGPVAAVLAWLRRRPGRARRTGRLLRPRPAPQHPDARGRCGVTAWTSRCWRSARNRSRCPPICSRGYGSPRPPALPSMRWRSDVRSGSNRDGAGTAIGRSPDCSTCSVPGNAGRRRCRRSRGCTRPPWCPASPVSASPNW